MDSRYNLKDIARKAAEAGGDVEYFQEPKQTVINQNTAPNNPAEDFEDSPAVIIGSAPKKTNESVTNVDTTPKPVIPDMSEEDYASTTEQANLSSEDIEKLAPHLPEAADGKRARAETARGFRNGTKRRNSKGADRYVQSQHRPHGTS